MKKQVLGFMSITQYADNTPGVVSKVGELSTWSSTYSTSKGEYADSLKPGYLLTTFSVVNTADGKDTTLKDAESRLYIRLSDAIVDYSLTHVAPLNPIEFRDYIQAEFHTEIENLTFGALVESAKITLPAWINFTQKAEDKNEVRIWYADSNFSAEYPDFDITIVPPYPDLNIFAGNWQNAVNKLVDWPNMKLIEEVQRKKDLNPETYLRGFEFEFVNRINPTQKTLTTWYALIYGEAGDDEDVIKDAIIDKLVTETGRDEQFWETVFPELFKRTEFILYPRWDRLSIPNLSDLTSLYSPFIDLKETQAYVSGKATFYPAAHVSNNIFAFPLTYKSIAINGVNGLTNVDAQKTIRQTWPDYIAVPTDSPDFQRMQPKTMDWVHDMVLLISTAETATSTSMLPRGVRRRFRDGKVYLSINNNKANYLAYARLNDL